MIHGDKDSFWHGKFGIQSEICKHINILITFPRLVKQYKLKWVGLMVFLQSFWFISNLTSLKILMYQKGTHQTLDYIHWNYIKKRKKIYICKNEMNI